MFNNSKYTRLYFKLISKFANSSLQVAENHHVIPRSLGGSDDSSNIARIPVRVHFILHKCLIRMLDDPEMKYRMVYAAWRMMRQSKFNHRGYRVTSREYELAKLKIRERMRTDNPMFREEVRSKMRGKRPAQSDVARKRNEIYWTVENCKKAELKRLQLAVESGLAYEIVNVKTGEITHFYIKRNIKERYGLKSINPGKVCQSTYLLKRVRVDSVAKFNPQDSDES